MWTAQALQPQNQRLQNHLHFDAVLPNPVSKADFALDAEYLVAAFAAHGDGRSVAGPDAGENDVVL